MRANQKMRMSHIILASAIFFLTLLASTHADLSCQVTESCPLGDVLHISALTDAHAQLATQTGYPYIICCNDTGEQHAQIGSSCSIGTTFLHLSDITDAHTETTAMSAYHTDACISSDDAGFICGQESGSCAGWETCLATISAGTDAHIADCQTDPYSIYICCNLTYTNTAPSLNSITPFPAYIIGGSTITITANSVHDPQDDNLSLFCSHTPAPGPGSQICEGGLTEDDSAPYALNCTFTVPSDNSEHSVYCRVYDGEFYSDERSANYTSDSIVPSAPIVTNVDGDVELPYWDTSDNTRTIIQTDKPEQGIACRWSTYDTQYSNINSTKECTIGASSISCDIGDIPQASSYTYHISCRDLADNEQSTSENTDVTFGVDWSEPTTYVTGYGQIYPPGHNITFYEDDNIGTVATILTWECHPDSGCTPQTETDNGSQITFTTRGTNFITWYSKEEAENYQPTQEVQVEINSLPVMTGLDYSTSLEATGKKGSSVFFTCSGTDDNGGYSSSYLATLWIKQNTSSDWGSPISMSYTGLGSALTYIYELPITQGYPTTYDARCLIQDPVGETSAIREQLGLFTVVNSPPIVDDVFSAGPVSKYGKMRIYCDGSDPDGFLSEGELQANLSMRTDNASEWNRLDNVAMDYDGTDHYIDLLVTDDGGTGYDIECVLSDGRLAAVYGEYRFRDKDGSFVTITDDWDHDGVSDSEDRLEGNVSDINTTVDLSILINGTALINAAGLHRVEFRDNAEDRVFVTFDHDFGSQSLLLQGISVFRQHLNNTLQVTTAPPASAIRDSKSITIMRKEQTRRGEGVLLNGMEGINKTILLPRRQDSGKSVCVKDAQIQSLDEIGPGCDGPDELFFIRCDEVGQTRAGITCRRTADVFEITGLMHSAAIESGNSRLAIWSEGDYMQYSPVDFFANYTNISSNATIISADCLIHFADTGWHDMAFDGELYNYTRDFIGSGERTYTINCSHNDFSELSLNDTFTISTSAVPEFSALTSLISIAALLGGMIIIKRRRY